MATRANPSSARKEKKPTPSNSRTIHNKQTNNVAGATVPVTNKVKMSTASPSAKPIPNYLKPTHNSKTDSLTVTKKTINDDLSHNVARRRSFDRPPSVIRNQKSLISPNPKERGFPRERQLATKSSSFSSSSSKFPTPSKPVLERNSKSLKPIRSLQQSNVRRSSSFSKTTSSLKNGSIASPRSTNSSINRNVEETMQELESKESPIQEANNVESEDDHMHKAKITEDVIVDSIHGIENIIKDGTVTEEDGESSTPDLQFNLIEGSSEILDGNHETESHNEDEIINHTLEEEENQEKEESNSNTINHQPEEEGIAEDAPKIETEEEKGEEQEEENGKAIENPVSAEEAQEHEKKKEEESEEIIVQSKEVVAVVKEEEEEEEEGKTEEKDQSNNGGSKGQGKKESPAAYNDVIEETKNRLLEKRKNKVKALVGAFETVIDYETAGSNSNK